MKEIKGKFSFDGDSKRYHRYKFEADKDVVGVLYVPEDSKIPERVILENVKTGNHTGNFKELQRAQT